MLSTTSATARTYDLITLQSAWIAGAIQTFAMLPDDVGDGPVRMHILQDVVTDLDMGLDQAELDLQQVARLAEDFRRYADLSDVVHHRRKLQAAQPLDRQVEFLADGDAKFADPSLMASRVGIAHFRGRRKRSNGLYQVRIDLLAMDAAA